MEYLIFLVAAVLIIPCIKMLIFPDPKTKRYKPKSYYRNMGGNNDFRNDRHIPW